MRKSIILVVLLVMLGLEGRQLWRRHQEMPSVQTRTTAQWDEVLKLHKIVHVTGLETIEAQVLRTDLTPEYRQFLADSLPSWKLYLEDCAPDVDMLAAEFRTHDATTMEEVRQRDERLAELTSRVMMPWVRIAYAFPKEKVARE